MIKACIENVSGQLMIDADPQIAAVIDRGVGEYSLVFDPPLESEAYVVVGISEEGATVHESKGGHHTRKQLDLVVRDTLGHASLAPLRIVIHE